MTLNINKPPKSKNRPKEDTLQQLQSQNASERDLKKQSEGNFIRGRKVTNEPPEDLSAGDVFFCHGIRMHKPSGKLDLEFAEHKSEFWDSEKKRFFSTDQLGGNMRGALLVCIEEYSPIFCLVQPVHPESVALCPTHMLVDWSRDYWPEKVGTTLRQIHDDPLDLSKELGYDPLTIQEKEYKLPKPLTMRQLRDRNGEIKDVYTPSNPLSLWSRFHEENGLHEDAPGY